METLKKRRPAAKAVWAAAVAALIVLFLVFSGLRPFANFVTKYFSRPVKDAVGTVFSVLPFSVMELEYILAALLTVWHAVRTVILTARSDRRLRTFFDRAGAYLLTVASLFTLFLWCFAIDYRSDSFVEKSGLDVSDVSYDDLYAVTKYFLENAAARAYDVERDGGGHWAERLGGYLPSSATLYSGINREFPFLSASSREPKRMYLFSRLSSRMGFTGVYFPFSGESNINIDAPGCLIPSTIAHELAHQKGVYSEKEANFVGIAACVSSGDPVYTYSGYLAGAIYLSSALYDTSKAAWDELSKIITGPMLTDWLDNSAYWNSFNGPIEDVSSAVYDGYLKAQGQPLGIRSYDACVELLVAFYIGEASA